VRRQRSVLRDRPGRRGVVPQPTRR
jgi:hypothetical protein